MHQEKYYEFEDRRQKKKKTKNIESCVYKNKK